MEQLKVEIDLVLPDAGDACDACVQRLIGVLRGRQGVTEVHVDRATPDKPRLCLHYDPKLVRLERIEAMAKDAGAELARTHGHLSVAVSGLRHERQAKLAEGVLEQLPGVLDASISFGVQRLFVEFDPKVTSRGAVLAALPSAGLAAAAPLTTTAKTPPSPSETASEKHDHGGEKHDHGDGKPGEGAAHEHDHGGPFGERSELYFSLICGALTIAGWALGKANVANPTILRWFFFAAYGFGSWYTLQEVVVALRAKRFEIDFLMLLAAGGAAVLGEWFEGALLLFLFTLGHALESFAMSRARNAIEALGKLVPAVAVRIGDDGVETTVPVEQLSLGDRIRVKPNSRISADGFVVSGTSSVDQAPITGESVPVEKRPVDDVAAAQADPTKLDAEFRVYAGTINGPSALTVSVTKVAADSTLARVVKMVAEAQTQKSPTQQFTDRFERIFVPVVIALVVALLFKWVVMPEPFSKSFYRAMAVLVAASPCALAIATPSAVLSGIARAARGGVLIKGGAHLESLGTIGAIAFDKTGTLTEGKPKLTDVSVAEGATELDLLRVGIAVEKQSDHPLASAIVKGGAARLPQGTTVPTATEVEAIIGFGVRANVEGRSVLIGKPGLFTREGGVLPANIKESIDKLQGAGRTVMIVRAADAFLGAFGVMDTPRESAKVVIGQLRDIGVRKTIMLTGDNQRVADAVAGEIGITEARGDLLPEQKVSAIAELAASSSMVAMVGDGVNDAPAMANATVGIAMGGGSSDVALETADVALMGDDLSALPFAVGLSRAARRIIRQNLWASLGMVAFLIPATIFGIAGIGVAVIFHEGSTLLVVANALRLLAYRDPARGKAK